MVDLLSPTQQRSVLMYSDRAAYVVFEDDSGHWWSPFLKKDIRHCFVIIPHNGQWITHEKISQDFVIISTSEPIYSGRIVKTERKKVKKGLFMLNTCVSHTKQILGINNPFIITPNQLYKYLRSNNEIT